MLKETIEHLNYLDKVCEQSLISSKTAHISALLWFEIVTLKGFSSKVPVPAACTGPDGQMFYSWDKGEYHLEMEIFPDKPIEIFYRNRKTNDYFGIDYETDFDFPVKAIEFLKLFI